MLAHVLESPITNIFRYRINLRVMGHLVVTKPFGSHHPTLRFSSALKQFITYFRSWSHSSQLSRFGAASLVSSTSFSAAAGSVLGTKQQADRQSWWLARQHSGAFKRQIFITCLGVKHLVCAAPPWHAISASGVVSCQCHCTCWRIFFLQKKY